MSFSSSVELELTGMERLFGLGMAITMACVWKWSKVSGKAKHNFRDVLAVEVL